ncbi:MAG TPA: hypothetical protein VHT52_17910 [Stellaceae bacterium]|jgi:hypothetical protein|nr:hypothetical protein [Stellaceae bacterium]
MSNIVELHANGPLTNAERQRRYRERKRNAERNEAVIESVTRNAQAVTRVTAVTRNGGVTRNGETVTRNVTAYPGVTVTTAEMIGIAANFEAGYVTLENVGMAARIITAFVHSLPPDATVTLPVHVTGSVTDDVTDLAEEA